ncbi:MAG: FHA domain-containing protein [Anaerolineales bacterium]
MLNDYPESYDDKVDDLTGIQQPSRKATDTLDAMEDTYRERQTTPPLRAQLSDEPTPPPPPQKRHVPVHTPTGPTRDSNETIISDRPAFDANFCPFCSAARRPDEPFCYNCGNLLAQEEIPLCHYCETPLVPAANYCYYCGRSTAPVPEIRLTYSDDGQIFDVIGTKDAHTVGRTVAEQNHFVDVDLGPLGNRRISRHHARFILKEDEWFLEDLGSKGGTRVYNSRLQPNNPVRIETGMVIYFADLKFTVELT